jgi:hypothetical protein
VLVGMKHLHIINLQDVGKTMRLCVRKSAPSPANHRVIAEQRASLYTFSLLKLRIIQIIYNSIALLTYRYFSKLIKFPMHNSGLCYRCMLCANIRQSPKSSI